MKKFVCCICNKEIENEYGNNPWPIKLEGRCCNRCNIEKVIVERIKNLNIVDTRDIQL